VKCKKLMVERYEVLSLSSSVEKARNRGSSQLSGENSLLYE